MRSVAVLAFLLSAFAGCLGVDSPDGALRCSEVAQRACPEGFYCLASDNTCWRFGHFPDMGVIVPPMVGPQPDFSFPVGEDMTAPLDGGTDALPPDDLLQTD